MSISEIYYKNVKNPLTIGDFVYKNVNNANNQLFSFAEPERSYSFPQSDDNISVVLKNEEDKLMKLTNK